MTHRLLLSALLGLCSNLAFAELEPEEINGYFNPGPDAYTDLDAIIDINHQSDMADSASVIDIEIDFDYLQLDLDTQVEFDANGDLTLTKDDGSDLDFGIVYEQRAYATSPDSIIGRMGRIFQFIDGGTADPRSFWFTGASLTSRSDLLVGDNVNVLGAFVGFGRGRNYPNLALHKAWALTQYLSASGRLSGSASTSQLYDLAKIIDDWFKSSRAAIDEGHNLPKLIGQRAGTYRRQWFQEIWRYLHSQGLVTGTADLNAVFDMRDALDYRTYSTKWSGGAEIQFGLDITASSENIEDNFNTDACDRVLIGVNSDFCGTNVNLGLAYEQAWPLDIQSQFSANAAAVFNFDADASILLGVGYLTELNEYLLWDSELSTTLVMFDDTESFIAMESSLEYELGSTSSLISGLQATINDDGDFDHALTVQLAFDLM